VRVVDAGEVTRLLDHPTLIEAIRAGFSGTIFAPPRHHHAVPRAGAATATLLLMPAWQEDGASGRDSFMGVKLVSVFPDNARRGKPSVQATYLLISGETGEPLACIDGQTLTLWRTAATSALAASALARADASSLTMIGAGALAPHLIAAHASVRPIREVTIWNRTADTARRLANALNRPGLAVTATDDLEAAVAAADIVSAATLSRVPLIHGAWLKPGTHVDLVGAYAPDMREADDEAIERATVAVDTRAGMRESGDIALPLASGVLAEGDIAGDLYDIAAGRLKRSFDAQITLFKSVGHAIEDLAAAVTVWRRLNTASASR
jgi:ornithine cyclodeaminase